MGLESWIQNYFRRLSARRRRRQFSQVRYFPPFGLAIPPGHPGDSLILKFPSYDIFFPLLSAISQERRQGITVDVGANIGLNFAKSCEHFPNQAWILMEGDLGYADTLESNVRVVASKAPNASGKVVRAIVGNESLGGAGKIVTDRGTGSWKAGEGGNLPIPLDKLLPEANSEGSRVVLLKIDTDGYDWNVLESAGQVIENDAPMIFFEAYVSSKLDNLFHYDRAVKTLERFYTRCAVFDNAGGLIHRSLPVSDARELILYTYRHTLGLFSKKISYFDFLLYNDDDVDLVNSSIELCLRSLEVGVK